MKKLLVLAICPAILLCVSAPVYAQEGPPGAEKWDFTVIPYLWATDLDGDITVKGVSSEVDMSFSDIWDNLDFAGQIHLEATKGKWGLFLDPTYMKLSVDEDVSVEFADVDVEVDTRMWLVEFGGFCRLFETTYSQNELPLWFDALAGGRYVNLKNEIDIEGSLGLVDIDVDDSQDWVDPIIGGRFYAYLGKKLLVWLRGDIGGFDVGDSSDFAWNVVAGAGYEITDSMTLMLAYRILDIDYDDGSGNDRFEFDAQMQGPMIGLAIRF